MAGLRLESFRGAQRLRDRPPTMGVGRKADSRRMQTQRLEIKPKNRKGDSIHGLATEAAIFRA